MHISPSTDLGSEYEGSKFLVNVSCTALVYTVSTGKSSETSDFIMFGQIQLPSTLCCLTVVSFQVLRLYTVTLSGRDCVKLTVTYPTHLDVCNVKLFPAEQREK